MVHLLGKSYKNSVGTGVKNCHSELIQTYGSCLGFGFGHTALICPSPIFLLFNNDRLRKLDNDFFYKIV